MSTYIIVILKYAQRLQYYGFHKHNCESELLQDLIQSFKKASCPPLECADQSNDIGGMRNHAGEILNNGSIDRIKDVSGKLAMHQLGNIQHLIIYDFDMSKFVKV